MEPISIIIPTYNREKYIERAIYSVLNQTVPVAEIIVIDDGSTDNTKNLVENINHEVPIVYKYIENSGPSVARNLGVELSKHELIGFLDSDDHWFQNKISMQLSHLRSRPEYKVCHTGEKWLRRGEHLNKKDIHFPRGGDIFGHCLQICGVGMSTVLMKKELFFEVGGFDPDLPCCEDYDLWLRISSKTPFLLIEDELIVKEGGREDQLSFQYRVGMDKYRIYAIEKLLEEGKLSTSQRKLALKELTKKCLVYGKGCIKHSREAEGLKYLAIPEKYISK